MSAQNTDPLARTCNQNVVPEATPSAADCRRPYVAPSLRPLGHVANVTQKSGPLSDVGHPTKHL
jgi:hypothetical protein